MSIGWGTNQLRYGIPAYGNFEDAAASCYHKEHIKIKTYNYLKLSATETKNMVQGVQKGDPGACLLAYHVYKPLILVESHRPYVISCLGEDAEDIAWELFYEFIHGYQGNKFRLLPGLIQKHLYFELLHKVYPRSFTSVEAEAILDETDDDGKRLYDPASSDTDLEKFHNTDQIHYLLSCLTAKQKDVVLATVMGHETLEAYSQRNGVAFSVAFLRRRAALKKMRKLLQTE